MQTKLAFLFVLHVMFLGVLMARRGAALRARNFFWLLSYLFAFYVLWGVAMQTAPGIYVPDMGGGGVADGAAAASP